MTNKAFKPNKRELVDLRSPAPVTSLSYLARDLHGGVTLAHSLMPANTGVALGMVQVTIAVLLGRTLTREWGLLDSDQFHSGILKPGCVDIYPANQLVWQRWYENAEYFMIAMDEPFFYSTVQQALDSDAALELEPCIGVSDPVIRLFADLLQRETRDRGEGSRVYVETLARALAIHVARSHGVFIERSSRAAGKLSSHQLRTVIAYISDNLINDLSLEELASVVKISPYHFAHGFKQTMGISPHRYVLERRIERVKDLLANSKLALADIASTAGFSSQSHMTTVFRRFVRITPKVFRDSL